MQAKEYFQISDEHRNVGCYAQETDRFVRLPKFWLDRDEMGVMPPGFILGRRVVGYKCPTDWDIERILTTPPIKVIILSSDPRESLIREDLTARRQ